MAKRINITIPDEMYRELQAVKDKINVSKICQEAIMKKLETIKAAQGEDLINFLRSGKMEHHKQYEEKGRKDARAQVKAKNVDYPSFLAINQLAQDMNNEGSDEWYDALKGIETGMLWDAVEDDIKEYIRMDGAFDVDIYCSGLVDEICKIFEELKDKI